MPKWTTKTLSRHQMVSIGHDLVVIGGHSERLKGGYSNNLFKLSCSNNACKWETLSQKMKTPRYWFVAISVPDDFVACTNRMSEYNSLTNCSIKSTVSTAPTAITTRSTLRTSTGTVPSNQIFILS